MDGNSRNRLLAYYKLMMSDDNGQVDDKKAKTLDYIVGNLQDSTVETEVLSFDKEVQKEKQTGHLKKYAELFGMTNFDKSTIDFDGDIGFVVSSELGDITIENEKKNSNSADRIVKYAIKSLQKKKDVLDDLMIAYSNVDTENEITVEVNGNKFTYDKRKINIDNYMEELIRIGNEKKGCSWDVEIDKDGELIFIC